MNYADERWLKVYTRDTGGWTMLSWQARGLALEIARKLDASGSLPLVRSDTTLYVRFCLTCLEEVMRAKRAR